MDARRCTVQLSNGRLYLDAVAAPETSLLGHDFPALSETDDATVRQMLSCVAPGFVCVGTMRSFWEAAESASFFARSAGGRNGRVVEANAADGEPGRSNGAFGTLLVSENETFGRGGRWLASSAWGRTPDLVVVGEALALGLPFGAVLANRGFAPNGASPDGWPEAANSASPAALSRVAAAINTVEKEGLLEHGGELAEYLAARLSSMRESCPQIAGIESNGLSVRMTLRPALDAAGIRKGMCERGVLVGVDRAGRLAIDPPLPLRIAEADVITGALRGALLGLPMVSAPACCAACQASD